MFADRSLRIVAGLLLWSFGWVVLAVGIHGRIYGIQINTEELHYVRTMSRSVVFGSFLGLPMGVLLNIADHPMLRNVGAVIGGLFSVAFAKRLAEIPFPFPVDRCYSALIYGVILSGLFGIAGAMIEKKKVAPFGAK